MMKLKKMELEEQGKTARLQADPGGAAHQAVIEDSLRPLLESLHRALRLAYGHSSRPERAGHRCGPRYELAVWLNSFATASEDARGEVGFYRA